LGWVGRTPFESEHSDVTADMKRKGEIKAWEKPLRIQVGWGRNNPVSVALCVNVPTIELKVEHTLRFHLLRILNLFAMCFCFYIVLDVSFTSDFRKCIAAEDMLDGTRRNCVFTAHALSSLGTSSLFATTLHGEAKPSSMSDTSFTIVRLPMSL
jgi:hypothetical protein